MADINRATVVAEDHDEFDRLTLIRLGVWGLSAFLSLTLVVVAAQSDVGVKRAAAAVASIASPPRDPTMTVTQVMARTAESERETRRLMETVRSLSAERDRLVMRLDSVEREVGDLTGSITKSIANNPAQAKMAPPEKPSASVPNMGLPPATQAALPAAAPVATTPPNATLTVTPAVVPPPSVPPQANAPASTITASISTAAMLPSVQQAALDPKTARPAWPSFMPPPTTPSIDASPPPASDAAQQQSTALPENIPLPRPSPLAALQAYAAATARGETAVAPPPDITNSVDTAQAAASPAAKTDQTDQADSTDQPKVEIGIDLGPGLSIAGLRTRWEAFKKAQGATINGIRPLVAIREISPKKPVELRLVVGPLAGIDVAVQLCASLSGSQFPCQPAVFDGQRLVLR